ncbi:restriction endonuclease subunit S [Aliarcobacter sp. ERUVET-8]|uniref:restriction endonuclease subunit S n=1 Tax=Aliarcobacter sp. ERUVET-8 TaxID=3429684 RepID=UPI003D6C6770
MSKSINIPKLRFKEFSGEWVNTKLGNLGNFQGGGTPATSEDKYWIGNIPWISSSDIIEGDIKNIKIHRFINDISIKESATKLIAKNSILFVSRVGIGKVAIANTDLCTSQDFTNLTLIKDDSYFIGYYFLSKNRLLEKYSQGTSIKGFTMNDLKTLKLNLPSKQEQEKIASFLTSVDTKIEQLTKKEELLQQYKKSIMQKIFNQEIRFKADDGSEFCDWEEKKLGDILDYIQPTKYLVKDTEYNDSYTIPVLTAGKTFILGYTSETDGVFENNLPVIIFDDFTTANKFVNFPFKAKSSAMKILIPKNNNNIKFIYEAMQMIKYEVGGHERHWISKFSFLNIFIPCIEEQTKIANFLSAIDTKIEQTQKQLESSKEFKKALLQQMFV